MKPSEARALLRRLGQHPDPEAAARIEAYLDAVEQQRDQMMHDDAMRGMMVRTHWTLATVEIFLSDLRKSLLGQWLSLRTAEAELELQQGTREDRADEARQANIKTALSKEGVIGVALALLFEFARWAWTAWQAAPGGP